MMGKPKLDPDGFYTAGHHKTPGGDIRHPIRCRWCKAYLVRQKGYVVCGNCDTSR